MRILQVLKTSDGASWAVNQVAEHVRASLDVHVALPRAEGREIENWKRTGATLHFVDCSLPTRRPWQMGSRFDEIRRLVRDVAPDVIHSHFVTTTLALRLALGSSHPTPRLFQVPGPLHLENPLFARLDLATAGARDHWLASSRHIQFLYARRGVPAGTVAVSYYGTRIEGFAKGRTHVLRRKLGISDDTFVVGNVSYMYPPKFWLGHTVGVKCLEDVIDALARVTRERRDVIGVVAGGAWGRDRWYEHWLRRRARRAGGRILMPGFLPYRLLCDAWADFDLIVHVPLSENCGGVVEAMVAGVPVIASRVGGLPEMVVDGQTGWLVPPRDAEALAAKILEVVDAPTERLERARRGRLLVSAMFDVTRNAEEVREVYRHMLAPEASPLPAPFDPAAFLELEENACS
jgi:glycosyltransferase involved in cell wall biosynthesis